MIRAYRELPLAQDATNRFLPWTIGLMVFMGTLALAVTLILAAASGAWRSGLSGTLTVQVLPLASAGSEADLDRRAQKVIGLLRRTSGIATAEAVEKDRLLELLEPWLGPGLGAADLPLPRLIDVKLSGQPRVDIAALSATLQREAPGTTVDDHGVWLERLVAFARGLEGLALGVMALIVMAAVATVVFTTRTGLAVHREVIELLHLIGARDDYIAGQFQRQALRLAAKGGLTGFALAVATLVGIARLAEGVGDSLLPDLTLSPAQWGALLIFPIAAMLIGVVTARVTVLRALGRRL